MTDFLGEKRAEIIARMKVLQPSVDEFALLQAAAEALGGVGDAPSAAASPNGRRGRGRPPGRSTTAGSAATTPAKAGRKPAVRQSRPAAKAAGTRGRRKDGGERGTQALQVIVDKPGVTIPEIATETGIKQSYLYRTVRELEQEGLVSKQGRGWHSAKVAA